MLIPGSNLLAIANRVIAQQTLLYKQFAGRIANNTGVWVATYAATVTIQGNIQPVPRNRYENMGLDFQKNYAEIFVQKNVIDIARDVTGDQFAYNGRIFEAQSRTDWFGQDSWDQVLCVEVPADQQIMVAQSVIVTYSKALLALV